MRITRALFIYSFLFALGLAVFPQAGLAGEHAGEAAKEETADKASEHKEHAGKEAQEHKEHAGKEAEEQKEKAGKAAEEHKEHAGEKADEEHSALDSNPRAMMKVPTQYYAKDIKAALTEHITKKIQSDGGVFKIMDPEANNQILKLQFVKIHDPVREIKGRGYFACSDFSVAGDTQGKLYDLDFWLNPKDGKLAVTETKIHKEPAMQNGKWEKKARYTFINDNPVVVP